MAAKLRISLMRSMTRLLLLAGLSSLFLPLAAFGQYTIKIAGISEGQLLSPNSMRTVTARCIDSGGDTAYNCNMTVEVVPYYNSNSHYNTYHTGARPKSSVSQSTGTGIFSFTLTTDEFGQEECLLVDSNLAWNVVSYIVGTGEPDISLFWQGEHTDIWHLNGGLPFINTGHGTVDENRYMQSAPAIGLYNATNDYLAANPGHELVCTNDQSLPFGGLFDIDGNWSTPHLGHRNGKSADIGGVTSFQCDAAYVVDMPEFEAACEARGADSLKTEPHPVGSPNHVHCQW